MIQKQGKSFFKLLGNSFKNVIISKDKEDSLKKFKNNFIDLVIIDISKIKTDGIKLIKQII